MVSVRCVAGDDDDPAALVEQGQRPFLDADVAGELGGVVAPLALNETWPRAVRLALATSPRRQDGEPLVVQQLDDRPVAHRRP